MHETVRKNDWIDDPVVAYGGVGNGLPCMWIFSLESYAFLDKLLHPTKNEHNDVAIAYSNFFNQMKTVKSKIKHEVQFL